MSGSEKGMHYDVTILGGGLAGLTLARQLGRDQPGAKVLVLEKRRHPAPEAAFKVGESSVEVGAWYFSRYLGMADHIRERQLPKLGLRFFFNRPDCREISDGFELGLTRLYDTQSFQLDRGRLETFLAEELQRSGCSFRDEARVVNLTLNEGDAPHVVDFEQRGVAHRVTSRWVIDASGRAAVLKKKLGLGKPANHRVNAAWFRLSRHLRVDDWGTFADQTGVANQRWLSTNHLMGEGYWVWLIPLASGATSVGIVADPRQHPLSDFNSFEKALAWLERHEPICAAAVSAAKDECMDFLALKNLAHDCSHLFSGERWALTGDAGAFLDPFYSPGSDFIAMANLMIGALIARDLRGRPCEVLANYYNQIYLNLFKNTMRIYEDQYHLYGNPSVMTPKILWDYATYWSFPAYLCLQGYLTDLPLQQEIMPIFDEFGTINARMQAFFRQWHALWNPPLRHAFIDQGKIKVLGDMNSRLMAPLDKQGFRERIVANLATLKEIAAEIVARAVTSHPELAPFMPEGYTGDTNHFELAWRALGLAETFAATKAATPA